MRIVFMGSAALACPALDALLAAEEVQIAAVVTRPDRPCGRGRRAAACPANAHARERGLTVLTPPKLSDPGAVADVKSLRPELIVVVAYGQLLKRDLLGLPPRGCVNLHPSLLPKYRGAAPIQWAIARGETETGVTTMYLDERLDAGDIIFQERLPIASEDTAGSLHDRLAPTGARLLVRTVKAVREGRAPRRAQDDGAASLAPKLAKADGRIDWKRPAAEIHNRVRGFNPWPGCYCAPLPAAATTLRIHSVRVEPGDGRPGEILDCGNGPLVAAGRDAVRLLTVQPAGGKRMSGAAYLRGHPLAPGLVLS